MDFWRAQDTGTAAEMWLAMKQVQATDTTVLENYNFCRQWRQCRRIAKCASLSKFLTSYIYTQCEWSEYEENCTVLVVFRKNRSILHEWGDSDLQTMSALLVLLFPISRQVLTAGPGLELAGQCAKRSTTCCSVEWRFTIFMRTKK